MQGYFGKIPGLGDFVTRELPRDFLDTWDDWLQRAIAESKAALGDAWLTTYLNAPIWRFVMMPQVCGESGWAGILMPSVDKVGRYFPLTFASSIGEAVQPFEVVAAANDWFDAAETLALSVLDEESINADSLAASIAALDNRALAGNDQKVPTIQGGEWGLRLSGAESDAMSSTVCHELVQFQVGPYSVWWTPGADDYVAMSLIAPELPNPQSFARLLIGSWEDPIAEEAAAQASNDQSTGASA